MSIPLNFYIDVSGQPKGTICVGLASINPHKIDSILKGIKKKYPKLIRSKQKGNNLMVKEIRSLIHFFNGVKIKMRCIKLKSIYWEELKEHVKNKQWANEIIYAALYFYAVKEYSKKEKNYPITVCHETYLDIEKVKSLLKKLGKAHRYNYQISDSYASQNEMIKIADIIAASGRKEDKHKLDLENYEIEHPQLEELKFYIDKLKK